MANVIKPTEVGPSPKPVQLPHFWRERILRTVARDGRLHQVIYDNSTEVWNYCHRETTGYLGRHVPGGCRVLDAGCGYGALLDCFRDAGVKVHYTGLDISPDLIELARYRYYPRDAADDGSLAPLPCGLSCRFETGDLSKIDAEDRTFHWVVARSVEGMILQNCGAEVWAGMFKELRRVGRNVMLLDYADTLADPVHCEIWRTGATSPAEG